MGIVALFYFFVEAALFLARISLKKSGILCKFVGFFREVSLSGGVL